MIWPMGEPLPVREGRLEAEELRRSLKLGAAPIRDLFGFIQRTWPEVLIDRRPMPDGPVGALLARGERWLIVVNTADASLMRQRFTVVHELGHHRFDASDQAELIETDLYRRNPVEQRANAFAVHFLLPTEVLHNRVVSGQLDPSSDEEIVALSFEFGLSRSSLAFHLLNQELITRRRCDEIRQLRPWTIAARIGLSDRVELERAARDATSVPRLLVARAAAAFERGSIGLDELRRILGDERANRLAEALEEEVGGLAVGS